MGALERFPFRQAEYPHDAASRRLHQSPLGFQRDRVAEYPAQVALGNKVAVVLEQIVQAVRVLLCAAGRGFVIAAYGLAELVADDEKLSLLVSSLGGGPEFAGGGGGEAQDRHGKDQREVGQPALVGKVQAVLAEAYHSL